MCGQLTWHKVRPSSLGSSSSDNVLLVKKGLVLSRGECVLVQHHHGAWCALRRTGRQATVIKLEKEITPPCLYWEQRYRGTPSHPPPPPFCVFLGVCVSVSLSVSHSGYSRAQLSGLRLPYISLSVQFHSGPWYCHRKFLSKYSSMIRQIEDRQSS